MNWFKHIYHLWSRFVLDKYTKRTLSIPNTVYSYKVVKVLLNEKGSDTFVALVENKKKQMYIAKVWRGQKQNYSYDSLKREYQIYKTLHRVIGRLGDVPEKFKDIRIPKIIDFIESKDQAVFIIEYIDGDTISSQNNQKLIQACYLASDYFEFLGEHVTHEERKQLGHKSYRYFLFAYPIFLFKALLSDSSNFIQLIKGLLFFSNNLFRSILSARSVLIHGDLNFENLIVRKNKIYPIDFQYTTFSYREYGYANTLRYSWDKGIAKNEFINTLGEKVSQGEISKKLLQMAMVIHGTQGLMATNFTSQIISAFKDYLKYGINFAKPVTVKKITVVLKQFLTRLISSFDKFLKHKENGSAVLCYHSFSKSSNRYAIDPVGFERQILKISQKSKFISLKEMLSNKSKINCDNTVLLTIDDGLKSTLDILPITKKYKIPVVLFVLAEPEKANRSELDTSERFLSWSDIKMLHGQGWEIGCHSATHINFSLLTKKQIEREILNSKKIIENKLGKQVKTFAYPKGIFSKGILDAVGKAGYKSAFSVLPGRVTKTSDVFALPRTIIDNTHVLNNFPALYSKSWLIFRRLVTPLQLWERFLT